MIKETEIKTNEKGQINRLTNNWTKNPTQMTQNQTGIYIQMKIDMHAKKMSKQCLKQEKIYFKCL